MGNGIKVSIIVPIYNSQEYVTQLFTQLTAQTLKEIEIVFVDDGSTDNTALLLQKHIETVPNAKYIYQQNSGAGAARNKGIVEASGDYFICLDADDMYEKDLVEKLYLRASKSSADIAICAFKRIDYWTNREEINLGYTKEWLPSKDVFVADDLKEPFRTFNHGPINKMYRTKFVKDLGLQYSSTKIANDVFFTLSTLLKAERIVFEKENLLTVRRHVNPNSITSNRGLHIADAIRVYKELYEFLVAQNMDDKYLPYLCQSVTTSFLYNSQYGVSQEFVMELAGWLQQEPWLSCSKQDIKNKFCVHKIEVLKRILNQNIAELDKCKKDKKALVETQIFFLQNKIANMEMLAEKIESFPKQKKINKDMNKPIKIPRGNFVMRCFRYVKANGLKSFVHRCFAELDCFRGKERHRTGRKKTTLWRRIKNWLKKFYPASKSDMQRVINREIPKQLDVQNKIILQELALLKNEICELKKIYEGSTDRIEKLPKAEITAFDRIEMISVMQVDIGQKLEKVVQAQEVNTFKLDKQFTQLQALVKKSNQSYSYEHQKEPSSIWEFAEWYNNKELFQKDYWKLVSGLNAQSIAEINHILSRQQLVLKGKVDVFTQKEQQQILALKDEMRLYSLEIAPDIFAYKNYFLPIQCFSPSVFYYKHGLSDLEQASLDFIKDKDILDVGGYCGDSVLIFSPLTSKKVYTFEASKDNVLLIHKTLELNNIKNAEVVPFALGDNDSTISLNIYKNASCISKQVSKSQEFVGVTNVNQLKLDSYLEANPSIDVGLIKVDIEGAEQDFLIGARKSIEKFRPVMLLSIYHNPSDFFNIKPIIESWNLDYQFKIHKPCDYSVSREVLLLCEPQPYRQINK